MAGEYRHQTITTTFLASPRRRDVVVAKLVAHSLTGALMGLLSLAVSAAIAVPWLHASGVDVHLDGDSRPGGGRVGRVDGAVRRSRASPSVPSSATRPPPPRSC